MNEVITLHPSGRYIHLGADETYYLATCPVCRKKAGHSAEGKIEVFIDHVSRLCKYVASKGRTPMIWGDMFWRTDSASAASRLPGDVVLMDWHYTEHTDESRARTAALREVGCKVWGATGIRCGYDLKYLLPRLPRRVENVVGWQQQLRDHQIDGPESQAGTDPDVRKQMSEARSELLAKFNGLESDIKRFWEVAGWGGFEEYAKSRMSVLHRVLDS